MFKILRKERLCEKIQLMEIEAPLIAAACKPGQFIIFRVDEKGERVPLTVNDVNLETGSVTIVFQEVGVSTIKLGRKNVGEYIEDFVGPLGKPSEFHGAKRVAVIGGGLGSAIAYPQAKALFNAGVKVDIIAGFRNKDLIILEKEMKANCDNLIITTDDGSNGNKGFVTNALKDQIESGANYDLVICIGPAIMMKFICLLTKEYNIKTIVSMNSIMIDGTGMCGCCRLTYDGKIRFACIDGPDFDGHKIDFDEAMRRGGIFKEQEQKSLHICNLTGDVRNG